MARRIAEASDPNRVISEAGLACEDPLAEKALDLFVSLYGAAAGDLALVAKAVAGVYVGGGIAPKILPKMRSGSFLQGFHHKGRLRPVLEAIPVKVILEPKTALIGAAACAAMLPAPARTQTRSKKARSRKKRTGKATKAGRAAAGSTTGRRVQRGER